MKIVLAYSGGLDTSVILAWLRETYDAEVVAYTADVGQGEEVAEAKAKALATGAVQSVAEDLTSEDGTYIVSTEPSAFHAVQHALADRAITVEEAEIAMVPKSTVRVEGDDALKLVKLLEAVEDLDDVQKVYSNADIDEAALTGAGA